VVETVVIAGAGAIACGVAVVAGEHGPVTMVARSEASAARADRRVDKLCEKLEIEPNVTVTCDPAVLSDATFVIEAIAEETAAKAALWHQFGPHLPHDAVLATTTSSLSITGLGKASGRPERFVGLHVFNPVPKMELVELVFTEQTAEDVRARARALCKTLGKTAIEVPDTPGFVVNRLLFPYLFDAVRLMERVGLDAEAIDACMRLGAGHPTGPLALLDYIGLDVAAAIGHSIGTEVPDTVHRLIAEDALGRKAGRGFHVYDAAPVQGTPANV
jgi:3-hydroxybutyryl-CoA dehydrogenase